MTESAVTGREIIIAPAGKTDVSLTAAPSWADHRLPRPTTEELARRHPYAVFLAQLMPSSRAGNRQMLGRVARRISGGLLDAETFPWHLLDYGTMAALQAELVATVNHRTASNVMTAVRGVLKRCRRLGLMSAEAYESATDLDRIKGESLPAGRYVEPAEVRALFAYLRTVETVSARRDAAGWALLFGSGIRRAELAGLTVDDYEPNHPDGARITVRHGKGNKDRICYLPAWAVALVEEWLSVRSQRPGALVCRCSRWDDAYPSEHMSLPQLWRSLAGRIEAAGLARWSCHDARRTVITTLLEAGHDVVKVQKAAGHSSPTVTASYDRRPERERAAMVESLPSPI